MRTLSGVPSGKAELAGELGVFRTAVVRGVEAAQGGGQGEPVTVGTFGFTLGYGMKGVGSTVTGLVLRCADDGFDYASPTPITEYMNAFHRDGGYAAIVQTWADDGNGAALLDNDGAVIGGFEIVRYTGWSGNVLKIDQASRPIGKNTLPHLANVPAQLQQAFGGTNKHSFVVRWSGIPGVDPPLAEDMRNHVYVVPISLAVPGHRT
jgi:hypothetical protein